MEDSKQVEKVVPAGVDLALTNSPGSGSQSDQIEQKIWNIVQGVPGLNVGYGSIRLVVYISKNNKDEALKSALGIAKGLVQSAAIVGSVFIAPIVTPLVVAPVAVGALTGILTESIQGAATVIIFVIEHSGELRKKLPASKEKAIYDEVKEMPTVGAVYSTIRAPIYAVKGDAEQVKTSGIGAMSGSAITAINIGLNVIPGLDAEGKSFIQKISQSIIQLLSRKVMEEVSQQKMTLEDGINLVKKVEEGCDTLEIITLENNEGGKDQPSVRTDMQEECGKENEKLSTDDVDRKTEKDVMLDEDGTTKTLDSQTGQPDQKLINNSTIKSTLKRLAKILKRENKRVSNGGAINEQTLVLTTVENTAEQDQIIPDDK